MATPAKDQMKLTWKMSFTLNRHIANIGWTTHFNLCGLYWEVFRTCECTQEFVCACGNITFCRSVWSFWIISLTTQILPQRDLPHCLKRNIINGGIICWICRICGMILQEIYNLLRISNVSTGVECCENEGAIFRAAKCLYTGCKKYV